MKKLLKKELPINTFKQRLIIYKKVLKKVETGNYENGLCVDLIETTGRSFDNVLLDTDILFPEFGKYINKYTPTKFLNLLDSYKQITDKWRIAVLKACIKQCEK